MAVVMVLHGQNATTSSETNIPSKTHHATETYDLGFTPEEKAWLDKDHVVRARVGFAPPLHFFDGDFSPKTMLLQRSFSIIAVQMNTGVNY